jgi:chromosomal replication initiation ATPase DnaA
MKSVGTSERLPEQSKKIGLAQAVVASALGVALDEMRTRTRKTQPQQARQLATYLARVVFEIGLRELAAETGRSPGTVFHACKQVEHRRGEADYDRTVNFLEHQLRQAAGVAL